MSENSNDTENTSAPKPAKSTTLSAEERQEIEADFAEQIRKVRLDFVEQKLAFSERLIDARDTYIRKSRDIYGRIVELNDSTIQSNHQLNDQLKKIQSDFSEKIDVIYEQFRKRLNS